MQSLSIVRNIACHALKQGWHAYIVGGYPRDQLLGLPSKDIDVEVFGPTNINALASFLSQHGKINRVGQSFSVIKLKVDGEPAIDFSLPRRDIKTNRGHTGFITVPDGSMSLEQASLRRDFTFNALFLDPLTDNIIDLHDGITDLRNRRLRHVSSRFAEDPLRVLRGMQFCGRFNLTADPSTVTLCKSLYNEYHDLSGERIWTEWEKWSRQSVKPSRGLVFLHRCGWLNHYPHLSALLRLPQDARHHKEGSVWQHTKLCVDNAAPHGSLIVFAALLHDIGKPATTEITNDRITTYGHDKEGEPLARDFLTSINAPQSYQSIIPSLVREHMVFTAHHKQPSRRVIRRVSRRLGDASLSDLITLTRIDLTSRGTERNTSFLDRIAEIAEEESCLSQKPEPILMGRHLIDMGLKPGKEFGDILRASYEAQLDGIFNDLEGALAHAETIVPLYY